MKFIQKSQANSFTNGPTCAGIEYPLGDKDINIAVVTVNGRYPEQGYAINEVCKEVGYVMSGRGSVTIGYQIQELAVGDAVLIQPGEKFYWRGENLEMMMPCSPAFYPEQHKTITE